ncbi:MAG: NAD(P)-binding domain-containing protein [Myxococcales bacterium]|nr:NAD(P)-binding domain-containing protein [Myxococcales bacterium]
MIERDVVVIGAGPGGLQVGHVLATQGRSFCLVERAERAGSFFHRFPRHRTLISVNKIHTGYTDERRLRFDWNSLLCDDAHRELPHYTDAFFPPAEAMAAYLQDFADRHVRHIHYGCNITSIDKRDDRFHLVAEDGRQLQCAVLVVATGVGRGHVPPIRGIELAEPYETFDVDPERVRAQRVLILGKGNSAFETADAMMHEAALIHLVSPHSIRMAWNTHFPGHLRAVNNNFLDTYQLKLQNAVLDADVTALQRRGDQIVATLAYRHADGEVEEVAYDTVIRCTGFGMERLPFAAGCAPQLVHDGRFPALTPAFESTNVAGLYFAGTVTQSLDYKRTNSAFVHGFRYNARALAHILQAEAFGVPLPYERVPADPDAVTTRLLARINGSSGLWQQFGFLGDAFVVRDHEVHVHTELPVQYLHTSAIGEAERYAVLTLEFGEPRGDVFAMQRSPDVDSAADSFFLHPVVRVYAQGVLLRTLHLLENLFGEWEHPQLHRRPLLAFVREALFDDALARGR